MTDALWYLGRGTGVVALVFLTLSVVIGIVTRSRRPVPGLPRFGVIALHRFTGLTATVLLAVHIVTLLFDPYAQLRLVDVVVPFLNERSPFWLGLGTLAFDLLLAIVITALLLRRVGARVFRAVYYLTYAMWPVALAHALGEGSDAGAVWFRAVALASAAVVAGAVGWRLTAGFGKRRPATRRRASSGPRLDVRSSPAGTVRLHRS